MNKQPSYTLSTNLNGSRSCYITVKRVSFLSVESIIVRVLHISNNNLSCFWTIFKNVDSLAKRQKKKNLFDLQKEYCAPGTETRIADIDNRFC